jgi:gliding motility-associated-like protein
LGCGVGNTNGAINISISGGKAPYNIVWEREIPGTEENPSPTYAPIGTNLLAVNNLAAGRYRLSITSSFVSCDNTDAITFTKFYELAAVETLQLLEGPFLSKSLCVGEPGTLQVKVFDRDSDTFSFYYDGTLVSSTPVGNDTYELTIDSPVDEAILNILNESGCGISVPIITGVGTPEFSYTSRSLEQTGLISANEDVTFTNTSIEPYTKMRWDFGDGSDLLEITAENEATTDIVHRYKTPGTFTVALRFYNALGCYKEVTQEVRVGKGYLVIFPSAFTPNEDGVNDLFEAKYTGITAFTIDIFDMWGNLLYTATVDSLPTTSLWGWNGTYPSGQPYTFKTFRYSFTAITHDDQEIKTAGEATLLR